MIRAMGKMILTILMSIILIDLIDHGVKANQATKAYVDVDMKLKLLNKPAVKSIKVSKGFLFFFTKKKEH